MNLFEEDYKKFIFNRESVKTLSIDFIDKYKIIPYCFINDYILFLFDDEVGNPLDLFKLYYFCNDNFYVKFVNSEEWNKIYNLYNFNIAKEDALSKYSLDNEKDKNLVLRESANDFYKVDVKNAPIVQLVDAVIDESIELGASDIHIDPNDKDVLIRIRVDGRLFEKGTIPLETYNEFITRIKIMANLDITNKLIPQDGKIEFNHCGTNYDIRIGTLPTIYGERIAIRLLNSNKEALTLDELGFNDDQLKKINKLIHSSSGLVLVVGPTGSGKSTTLQSFLKENTKQAVNIITVEDPVEYTIDYVSQVQVNDESGLTFACCLRSILRQDPNIIMIGEIRDLETAKIACRASITGHLVYSTLHTNTAIGVINRLIDMNIESYLLADSLRGIVSQRLVRVLCDKCKKKHVVTEKEAILYNLEKDSIVYEACGCGYCNNSGYKGRKAVYEIITIDDELKVLINNADTSKILELLKKRNHKFLNESLIEFVKLGITSIDEAKSLFD